MSLFYHEIILIAIGVGVFDFFQPKLVHCEIILIAIGLGVFDFFNQNWFVCLC